MATFKACKSELDQLKILFPSDHKRFRFLNARSDDLTVQFIVSDSIRFTLHGSLNVRMANSLYCKF